MLASRVPIPEGRVEIGWTSRPRTQPRPVVEIPHNAIVDVQLTPSEVIISWIVIPPRQSIGRRRIYVMPAQGDAFDLCTSNPLTTIGVRYAVGGPPCWVFEEELPDEVPAAAA